MWLQRVGLLLYTCWHMSPAPTVEVEASGYEISKRVTDLIPSHWFAGSIPVTNSDGSLSVKNNIYSMTQYYIIFCSEIYYFQNDFFTYPHIISTQIDFILLNLKLLF